MKLRSEQSPVGSRVLWHRRRARGVDEPVILPVDGADREVVYPELPIVAYVILSHQPDRRLERLVTRIRTLDPDARIHVNHNTNGAFAITQDVRRLADSIALSTGGRGDFSHIGRQLLSSLGALEDRTVDYVTVISGEDYPCASLLAARQELVRSGDGFVAHTPVSDPVRPPWPRREIMTRYYFRWISVVPHGPGVRDALRPLKAINHIQPWVRINTSFGGLRVAWRGNAPPKHLVLHAGPAWSCMSRRAVKTVAQALQDDSALSRWAARVLVADEVVVPTIVANAVELTVQNKRRFFVDFSQSQHGRPAYLDKDHLSVVLRSGAWFCRKVASAEFMDQLDRATDEATAAVKKERNDRASNEPRSPDVIGDQAGS